MIIKTWGVGGDYVDLPSAVAALPAIPADDYELLGVSNTVNSSTVTLPSSFNGKKLTIHGGNFLFTSNNNVSDINITASANVNLSICCFKILFNVKKTTATDAFIYLNNAGSTLVEYCHLNGNDGILHYCFNGSAVNRFNIVKNSFRGFSNAGGNLSSLNNTTYNCLNSSVSTFSGTTILQNNNFIGGTINGAYTDQGGNVTSDATGSPGYQNILATDAMNDPVNGDYRPIRKGPLLLSDGTYAGALPVPAGTIQAPVAMRKKKRKLLIEIMGG